MTKTPALLRCGTAAALLVPCLALAQASPPVPPPPPAPPVVPRPAELSPPAVAPQRGAELPVAPGVPPKELGKPEDDITLDVSAYAVDDAAPPALKAALPQLTAAFVGRERHYEDLQGAAAAVTRFLQQELGYYLGYAYLPAQKTTGGVVRIAVLEGRLDEVRLNWRDDLPVDRAMVQARLALLQPGEILTVRDVERVIFLLNDLRGISFKAEVEPGRTPGTASLVFTPRADAPVTLRLDADANGSRYIGTERLGALLSINSPTGAGDGLSVSGLGSVSGGLKFALVSYVRPLQTAGLKVGASYSATRYQLDGANFPVDYHGSSNALTLFGLYPWVRSRNLNAFVVLSTDRKSYVDTVGTLDTPKRVNSVTAGLTGDFRDSLAGGGVSTFDVNFSGGRIRYPNGRNASLDDAPEFTKLTVGLSRLQALLTNRLMLYTVVRGQYAWRNLDSTEQFRAGGPDGVRAYAPGEGTGDSGLIATAELRWLPPESWFGSAARDFVFGAFFDGAQITLRHELSANVVRPSDYVNRRHYGGAGLYGAWQWSDRARINMSLAWPTHGRATSDPAVREPRVYFQASWTQ